jgi:hypothetical protein
MPGGKRSILHAIDALNVGGAQELPVLLAEETPKSAYQTLVCVIQSDTAIKPRIESKGAPVYCFNRSRPSINNPFDFLLYNKIKDIRSLCRHDKVDVVHCHLSNLEFIGVQGGMGVWHRSGDFPVCMGGMPPEM